MAKEDTRKPRLPDWACEQGLTVEEYVARQRNDNPFGTLTGCTACTEMSTAKNWYQMRVVDWSTVKRVVDFFDVVEEKLLPQLDSERLFEYVDGIVGDVDNELVRVSESGSLTHAEALRISRESRNLWLNSFRRPEDS